MSFKVVFIGEGRVGKTSIGKRWTEGKFDATIRSTVSAALFEKSVQIGTKTVGINLWDTAGQEEYHSLTPIYYKDADAAILVYSVTDMNSFEKMKQWKRELTTSRGDDIKIFVVGNKTDLPSMRVVKKEDGEEFAKGINAAFYEVSAKTGSNIDTLFLRIAEGLLTLPPKPTGPSRKSKSMQITDKVETESQGGCC